MKINLVTYSRESYERAIRGYYHSGAFEIYLQGSFNQDISQISIKDQGTFLHEYIHFIQNIATPWGIFAAITRNNNLAEFVHSIEKEKTISIPYSFTPSAEQLERQKWLLYSIGTVHLSGVVDRLSAIPFEFVEIKGLPITMHEVQLNVPMVGGPFERIVLGAGIINECMAAMYQSLIDPNAGHPDIPYNLVQILCEQHFHNIAGDKIKLICLCYIALFSLDPGYSFMGLLKDANLHPEKSGWQILEEYSHQFVKKSGKDVLIEDFYNEMEDTYKNALRAVLSEEPQYTISLIDKMKMKCGKVLLLEILKLAPITTNHIQTLIDYLGVPFIHTLDGHQYYPINQDGSDATDVISMCGNYTMYEYFVHPNVDRIGICPFNFVCDFPDNNCYEAPWKVDNCSFDVGLKSIHAKSKEIEILK